VATHSLELLDSPRIQPLLVHRDTQGQTRVADLAQTIVDTTASEITGMRLGASPA
jgi:hypothetical protein